MTSYKALYTAAVAVALLAGLITIIQAADPLTLGFSPLAARWLAIFGSFLALVAGFLPRVQKPPNSDRQGLD